MLSLFSTSARSLSFTRLYQLSTTRPYALLIRLIVSSFATLPSLLLPPSFTISQIDLMEAAEATAMESAILWRVQTILETLSPGELDAWLHGVGLAGGIGELKSRWRGWRRWLTVSRGGRSGTSRLPAPSLVSRSSCMTLTTSWMRSIIVGSSTRSKEVCIHPSLRFVFFLDCDNHNPHDMSFILSFSAMIAPAIDLDGMVGDGAEQVDASANTSGIH